MSRHRAALIAAVLVLAPGAASAAEAARGRVEARLQRAGFELVGETRRKGDFLIVNAMRGSISWRLVVDGKTGDVVGQKPLGLPAAHGD